MMLIRVFLAAAALLLIAGTAQSVVKVYDSSANNGLPGDFIQHGVTFCPPLSTTPGLLQGHATLEDDGAGSVSLDTTTIITTIIDLGPDQFAPLFGPGSFIFIDSRATTGNNPPGGSVHVSVGPADDTDPGGAVEWGVVSGWSVSGSRFCISSPVSICNGAGFSHGATAQAVLTSSTYQLNTWAFDAEGDYSIVVPYIVRDEASGLGNNQWDMRGAFAGSALPALPLFGLGALALSLAVTGGRALLGKK